MKNNLNTSSRESALALLPLFVFILIFLGSGIYFQLKGTSYAFYQISSPVAILPAIFLAVFLSKKRLNRTIDSFLKGAGDANIMAMCMIYLFAGAFSSVAKATGGVDATVNLALGIIPPAFLLPGLFMVGAFISTAMGTSMGTLAALAPVALGIAQKTGLPLPLMAGTIMGGAMFGDNLSIISDTTIAATKTQGCEMREKFQMNFHIAAPAALFTLVLLAATGKAGAAPSPEAFNPLLVLPYVAILILALSGLNVFVTLAAGTVLAAGMGMVAIPEYNILKLSKDVYSGFTNMQEIFILSMLIGGLSALMKEQGGLAFLSNRIQQVTALFSKEKKNAMASELGIGAMVTLTNLCTANNTVSIIITGSVAREIAEKSGVEAKRSAGILDIFSCICQGLIPYGAQTLLTASIFGISPIVIAGNVHYCMILGVCSLGAIALKKTRKSSPT